MGMEPVIDVAEADFESRVVEASRQVPVVVDFWAGWCRPCLVLGPVLERVAGEYGGRFTLAKVDVDANQELAARFGIRGIPAVKAFRDGDVVAEFVGAQPEEAVRRFLAQLVPSEADEHVAAAASAGSPEEAEAAYRQALAIDPGNAGAVVGLARVLLDRGEVEEVRSLLGTVASDGEVRRLQAELDLRDAAASGGELGGAARAALSGDPADGLERLLSLVRQDGEGQAARRLMLGMFEVLGDEHPLTREYRSRLASALF
jgi:putative thioredoxin